MNGYQEAKTRYAAIGVDTEAALNRLANVSIALHCWQGDDIVGFENRGGSVGGGLQVTGDYPGRARTPEELMADIDKALSLIPGKHRLNLHACYAIKTAAVDRDAYTIREFEPWAAFAAERGLAIDFNPTLFGHPMVKNGMTLSHPDEAVRRFWIDHCKATRAIAAELGKRQGSPCLHNIWIPDGLKNTPSDRLGPRRRLKESLDEIYAVEYDAAYIADSLECKLFGTGVESYTTGNSEFYLSYAAKNGKMALLDNGHFHPTESVADKLSSLLLFFDKVALHVTRGVRWDSDHVVLLDDEIRDIAYELVHCDALDRTFIGLDYFDASVNRIAAWVTGMRSLQKALLAALLMPHETLRGLQDSFNGTKHMVLLEELKLYPVGAVWDEFCRRAGVPQGANYMDEVDAYEAAVLSQRGK